MVITTLTGKLDSKLPGAALRIAGNFHCALNAYNQPWASPISKETINNALKLSAILAEHALLVFGYMGADKSLEAAKKVWSWIERNRQEQFTARDCFQALKGTYKRMDDLNPAISVLIERYYIFEPNKEKKPGRPSRNIHRSPQNMRGMEMSWRELMKINTPTQYSHNPQKEPQSDSFGDIEDIEYRTENVKAIGYGCASCGNRIYEVVQAWEISELPESSSWTHEHSSVVHWRCEGCGAVFEIIGGSRGPQIIN